jgi:hypothetical protein
VSVLLLHQGGGILELTLQLTDLLSLLLDQLFHGLSKHALQLYLFFFVLVFNLTGPRQMFLDTLFHLPLRFGNFRAHPHNLVIFCLHFALERLHFSLQKLYLGAKSLNLGLESFLALLVGCDFFVVCVC